MTNSPASRQPRQPRDLGLLPGVVASMAASWLTTQDLSVSPALDGIRWAAVSLLIGYVSGQILLLQGTRRARLGAVAAFTVAGLTVGVRTLAAPAPHTPLVVQAANGLGAVLLLIVAVYLALRYDQRGRHAAR